MMQYSPTSEQQTWTVGCLAKALLGVSLIAGCSEDDGAAEVWGTVKVDGAPAASGAISFFPVDGRSSPVGANIDEGAYATRVPLGAATVEIRVPKVTGEQRVYDAPDSPVKEIRTESLPEKYNNASELQIEVKSGGNEENFDLATE